MATSAPSLAKAMATARPIPLSPPVMSATLPLSLLAALVLVVLGHGPGRHLRLDARLLRLRLGRLLRFRHGCGSRFRWGGRHARGVCKNRALPFDHRQGAVKVWGRQETPTISRSLARSFAMRIPPRTRRRAALPLALGLLLCTSAAPAEDTRELASFGSIERKDHRIDKLIPRRRQDREAGRGLRLVRGARLGRARRTSCCSPTSR